MAEPDFLLFASDAELAAFWGGIFLLIALALYFPTLDFTH